MPNFKIVIADPKTRKAYQKEIEQNKTGLLGKKIGDRIAGNLIDLPGYEFEITGGSDKEGFPMRADVTGTGRKRIVLAYPPGFHPKIKGQRKRKSVRGNTISQDIVQVNLKVVGYGQKSLDELFGKIEKKEIKQEAEKEKPTEKVEVEKTKKKE
jgi:small subunit ribosomal protein S6e